LLGYHLNKAAQQYVCKGCVQKLDEATHICYICGGEYKENRSGSKEGNTPTARDLSTMLGNSGQQEFSEDEVKRLQGFDF
jgi:hypothetical protein